MATETPVDLSQRDQERSEKVAELRNRLQSDEAGPRAAGQLVTGELLRRSMQQPRPPQRQMHELHERLRCLHAAKKRIPCDTLPAYYCGDRQTTRTLG